MQQVLCIGLACVVSATLSQRLNFVKQDNIDEFDQNLASDRLQWHDNDVHKQEWNRNFKHQVQNDFIEMVHIVFMNHLGMELIVFITLLFILIGVLLIFNCRFFLPAVIVETEL